MSDMITPDERFNMIMFDFRKFGSRIYHICDKYFKYLERPMTSAEMGELLTKEYCRKRVIDKCPDTVLEESKLNDLIESVYHTGKRYDLITFFQDHLPLRQDFEDILLDNQEWVLQDK